jgi:ribosomal protein L40E
MALIVCKDCGRDFSPDARRCPHCGAKKPRGKSGLGVPLLLLLGIGIIGGAFTDNKSPPKTNNMADDAAKDRAAWKYASVSIAEQRLKYYLKNADSAEFRNVGVIIPSKLDTKIPGVVCGEVNAKTGFGGYGGFTKFLVIAGIPAIDERNPSFYKLWNKVCANKPIEYPPGFN